MKSTLKTLKMSLCYLQFQITSGLSLLFSPMCVILKPNIKLIYDVNFIFISKLFILICLFFVFLLRIGGWFQGVPYLIFFFWYLLLSYFFKQNFLEELFILFFCVPEKRFHNVLKEVFEKYLSRQTVDRWFLQVMDCENIHQYC